MKATYLWIIILLVLVSCTSRSPELEEALKLAGDNRPELEAVLNHFKDRGKVPYKSACFLITNMKYHESKDKILIDNLYHDYFIRTDSLYKAIFNDVPLSEQLRYNGQKYDSLRRDLGDSFNTISVPEITSKAYLSDLETIRADFLIDNIEEALQIWEANGYTYKKDFDFFKEFILPYRTTNEFPVHKRSEIRKMYEALLIDTVSIRTKLERYKVYVNKCRWINQHTSPKEHLGIYDLFVPKFKMDCHNMTNWSCNVFRACGIPTMYEYTPKWTDRDNRHFWCVSPDFAGILQPYTAPDNNLREDWETDIKYAGKVYRSTFGAQKNTPYFMAGEDEFIPEEFNTPLLSDQTFRYHQTVTLRLPLKMKTGNKLAYLAMFTVDNKLVLVGWGNVEHSKSEIVFEQVPLNTLFFPVCYDDNKMLDISEPFIIHSSHAPENIPQPLTVNKQPKDIVDVSAINGKLLLTHKKNKEAPNLKYITLTCDTSQKVQLHLLRKYPEKRRLKAFYEKLNGACLLGGNQEEGHYDTLCIVKEIPVPYLQEITFENHKQYRYYRFSAPNGEPVNIAHMEFLGDYSSNHNCTSPTPLPNFSETEVALQKSCSLYRIHGTPVRTGSKSEYAFDNDFNTYVGSSKIGMDFKSPVQITGIRFIPRNANNMIVPGNSYMLLYYDGEWKEHKILYAEHHFLDFENVPLATLYWLKNLTEGKEELPFFYINGKQYFLHVNEVLL
ncbi:hypothetical protein [Bacteroides sp. UBA939]|uniref:hypothetical protein n=1 Tax=Bacteroides sp. UBA939 TaxID=1946092 RepID=UPI0025C09BE3|nr:hypothetical protein [Bacteroides sp. UBA939]